MNTATVTGREPYEPMSDEPLSPMEFYTPMPPEPDDDDPRTLTGSVAEDEDFYEANDCD